MDVAALLPFRPNAAALWDSSFVLSARFFPWAFCCSSHSPIMVLHGFVPLFFSGGPIGVLANRMGDILPLVFVLSCELFELSVR
ncbi:hypothetical protein KCP74_21995 [Salmonella enterica subsp. enterica]|nr:hypothetical protein KCP74_21995 [Salmonella enterica subsp. enterica]